MTKTCYFVFVSVQFNARNFCSAERMFGKEEEAGETACRIEGLGSKTQEIREIGRGRVESKWWPEKS